MKQYVKPLKAKFQWEEWEVKQCLNKFSWHEIVGLSKKFFNTTMIIAILIENLHFLKIEVEEVNALILFLLSDQASLITGSCMPVDGGSLCFW